jgi:four helix bundle protein
LASFSVESYQQLVDFLPHGGLSIKITMENRPSNHFNEKYREKTKQFAVALCRQFNNFQNGESARVVVRQLLRSGTSVAANFRAATRARSMAEYYAKICIVVEECDETQFWFEILEDANLIKKETTVNLHDSITELLKILTATKYKLHQKRFPPK